MCHFNSYRGQQLKIKSVPTEIRQDKKRFRNNNTDGCTALWVNLEDPNHVLTKIYLCKKETIWKQDKF